MNRKKIFYYSLACLVLAIFLIAATPGAESNRQNHCYSLLSPINENSGDFSQVLESKCFDSFSESIRAATKGRVQLDHTIQPEAVTEYMLNGGAEKDLADVQVVIGIDWDYTNFAGSSYTWVVSNNGCSSSIQYSISSMPAGWDNRVSSARAYSNCNYYYHYQNTNYGGSSVVCNTECSTMGSLDNATSSEKWTYIP